MIPKPLRAAIYFDTSPETDAPPNLPPLQGGADFVLLALGYHLAGMLAHWKWGLTNAFMEGLNSVFSATKRKARGYRSTTHLMAMLCFTAGKLRVPQF